MMTSPTLPTSEKQNRSNPEATQLRIAVFSLQPYPACAHLPVSTEAVTRQESMRLGAPSAVTLPRWMPTQYLSSPSIPTVEFRMRFPPLHISESVTTMPKPSVASHFPVTPTTDVLNHRPARISVESGGRDPGGGGIDGEAGDDHLVRTFGFGPAADEGFDVIGVARLRLLRVPGVKAQEGRIAPMGSDEVAIGGEEGAVLILVETPGALGPVLARMKLEQGGFATATEDGVELRGRADLVGPKGAAVLFRGGASVGDMNGLHGRDKSVVVGGILKLGRFFLRQMRSMERETRGIANPGNPADRLPVGLLRSGENRSVTACSGSIKMPGAARVVAAVRAKGNGIGNSCQSP